MKYREALYSAMKNAMDNYEETIIIGQGVTDFKGIFGTTIGLKDQYPERVIETPLAEDSSLGICIGAALGGLYPINTHIRADFSLLIFNQLINIAAKYKYMFGGLFEVPMMVRLIIGRSWGQGAQHSQSLQSLFAHIPGLMVLMPSTPESILTSYNHAVKNFKGPIVMLEHRLMYELEFEKNHDDNSNPFGSKLHKRGHDLTIVATSIMVLEAQRGARYLEELGFSVEIIDLHSISHPSYDLIIESVQKTRRLLVADTSWKAYGVCAEISRIICEKDPGMLEAPIRTIGMAAAPCPTAKILEDIYYPDIVDLINTSLELITGSKDHGFDLPQKQATTDFYKHFKGPF